MSRVPCFQIDAFTDRPFAGNPAAVCLLNHEPSDTWMQAVAAEMNLAETAFVRRVGDAFSLRWFTPEVEVDLCGHATLASAHALWTETDAPRDRPLRFETRSGVLTCERRGVEIAMNFPALVPSAVEPPAELLRRCASRRSGPGDRRLTTLWLSRMPRWCGRSGRTFVD